MPFHAGFVTILGQPNAGKSTLLNAILGERLSIVTHKAQTTRHRIQGILSGPDFQIVFSDTPGILKPINKLHERMMGFVADSLEDADVLIYVHDVQYPLEQETVPEKIMNLKIPLIVALNKIDLSNEQALTEIRDSIKSILNPQYIIPISATTGFNVDKLIDLTRQLLPEGPAYYEEDQLTDKSERFIASEIIRGEILMVYGEEVPYAVEVVVNSFKDNPQILTIAADIMVMRESQKPIIIGKGGEKIKRTGTRARKELEKFFGKKIYLELFVKVKENWRDNEQWLNRFGY